MEFMGHIGSLPAWFGRVVTELGETPEPLSTPLTKHQLQEFLNQGGIIRRSEACRFAFLRTEQALLLFRNGESSRHPLDQLALIALVCEQHHIDENILGKHSAHTIALDLLLELTNSGYWYTDHDVT